MAERVGFGPLGSVDSKELGRSCDPLDPPDSLKCLGRDTYEHAAPEVEELQRLDSGKDFSFWSGNSNPAGRRRELAASVLSDVRRLNGRKETAGELGITALIGSSIG